MSETKRRPGGHPGMRGAVMGAFLVDPTDIAVLLSLT